MAAIIRSNVINAGRGLPEDNVPSSKSNFANGNSYSLGALAVVGLAGVLAIGGYTGLKYSGGLDYFKSLLTPAVLAPAPAVLAPAPAVLAPAPVVPAPAPVVSAPSAVSTSSHVVTSEYLPPTIVSSIPDKYEFEYISEGETGPSRLEYICDKGNFNVFPSNSPYSYNIIDFLNDPRFNLGVKSIDDIVEQDKIEDVANILKIPNIGHYKADFREFIDNSYSNCH